MESKSKSASSLSVLITGGSGLIGRYLTSLLLDAGHRVSHLSRNASHFGKVRVYRWDPLKEILDPVNLQSVDCIIHLAGTNIGEKRWTGKRRQEITNSRVASARFLHRVVSENKILVKAFISASAIGYYGAVTSDRIFSENDPPSGDFLGRTCRLWEEAADLFEADGIRTVKIRTAVVLEKSDAALSRFLFAAKCGIFPKIGNGKQYLPWIHITDLCNIYLKALNDEKMKGAYNAVAPDHSDNKKFIRTLASVMGKTFISLPVPAPFLKLIMGDSSVIALKGSRISCEKIESAGYRFRFPSLADALRDAIK